MYSVYLCNNGPAGGVGEKLTTHTLKGNISRELFIKVQREKKPFLPTLE